ncbi:hypothetical protein C8Q73DRAFT_645213, partial [Cubamyces lactineus]
KVRAWLPFREDFLDEVLGREGCDEPIEAEGGVLCAICCERQAQGRCRDCFRRRLSCEQCLVKQHVHDYPLHRIEMWTGETFRRSSLRDLGLVVQLGHNDGTECPSPSSHTRRIVVGDVTGVQAVTVRFCECLDGSNDFTREWAQLLRQGWFPATTLRPKTAFTFQLLDTFQELNFQGKTNLFDFWRTIERLTDNSGDHKNFLAHVIRLWRHLIMLKRAGRAHDPTGAAGTKPGELVVECAACPHPGKNLPHGWETAPLHMRWLYTLFLMIDANFRARCKDRNLDPFELAPGWSYYVEESSYQTHLKNTIDRKEDNTCSAEHNAITKAHLRKEGYVASGIGAVLCARHALVRRNGAGDLQLGERYEVTYANMDYLLVSTLAGTLYLFLLISYDIACQWYRNFFKRMAEFPPDTRLDLSKIKEIRFTIPKKHYRVHGPNHSRFSLNLLPRVGRTYGEGIESHWSHMNPLALSTREMSLGMRHEVYNDHWGAWNWQKTIAFEESLLHSLEDAHAMKVQQRKTYDQYTSTFDVKVIREWEAMIKAWEEDPDKPDPYEEPQVAVSYATAKKALNEEEAIEAREGKFPQHEVTPGVFLQLGLELEDRQRALRARIASGMRTISELAEQQEKRNVLTKRIEAWQLMQDVHMPMVASLRAPPEHSSSSLSPSLTPSAPTRPENTMLWLPSALPPHMRILDTLTDIQKKEHRLRSAQLADSLDDIRRVRRILAAIIDYSKVNVSGTGQRATTRMQDLYARFKAKERRAVNRYRAARTALEALDPDGNWTHTYRPLLDEDLRGPRKQDDDLHPRTASEGRYQISWIWLVGQSPDSVHGANAGHRTSAEEFSTSMRSEWARCRARAIRWEEEEKLLLEEMRRVIEYFRWQAKWWRDQVARRVVTRTTLQRALTVYANRQADLFDSLVTRCGTRWCSYVKTIMAVPAFLSPFVSLSKEYHPRRSHIHMVYGEVEGEDISSLGDDAEGSGSDESELDSDSEQL